MGLPPVGERHAEFCVNLPSSSRAFEHSKKQQENKTSWEEVCRSSHGPPAAPDGLPGLKDTPTHQVCVPGCVPPMCFAHLCKKERVAAPSWGAEALREFRIMLASDRRL